MPSRSRKLAEYPDKRAITIDVQLPDNFFHCVPNCFATTFIAMADKAATP